MSKRLFGLFIFAGLSVLGFFLYSFNSLPVEKTLAAHDPGHVYSQSAYPEIQSYDVTSNNSVTDSPAIYYVDFRIANRNINSGESIKVTFPHGANEYVLTDYVIDSSTTPDSLETTHSRNGGTIDIRPTSTIPDGTNIHIVIDRVRNPAPGTYNIDLDVTGFSSGIRRESFVVSPVPPPPPPPPGEHCDGSNNWRDEGYCDQDCGVWSPGNCFSNLLHLIFIDLPNKLVSLLVEWVIRNFFEPIIDFVVEWIVKAGVWILEAAIRLNYHF